MTWLDDCHTLTADTVAEYVAGGYEPDGVGLALGSPVSPVGFGSDLSCVTDCDSLMTEVSGDDPRAVGEALQRRLMTPHGGLITDPELLIAVGEDPDYGFNLLTLLSVDTDPLYFSAARDFAAAEVEKDDRVVSGSAVVELVQTTIEGVAALEVRLYGDLVDGGTFDRTFVLTSSTLSQAVA